MISTAGRDDHRTGIWSHQGGDVVRHHGGTARAGGRPTRDAPGRARRPAVARERGIVTRHPAAEDPAGEVGLASRVQAAVRPPDARMEEGLPVTYHRTGTTAWRADDQVLSDAGPVGEWAT